jgi:hypothetical protein
VPALGHAAGEQSNTTLDPAHDRDDRYSTRRAII